MDNSIPPTTLFNPAAFDPAMAGAEMYALMGELYPICRSITGDGVRQTLRALQQHIPLQIHEVASGTQVFDWTVPREWNIRDAYVKDSQGRKVIDFQRSSLHVLNYSVPVNARMGLAELKEHLHSIPDRPHAIPYRTSYYREAWGFCLAHQQLEQLAEDTYEVVIDSTLQDGHLTYGELVLPGEIDDEVLISCHCCHPSLCNDNLSGLMLSTWLAKALSQQARRYTYRFLYIPGTIGSITWLAMHAEAARKIKHGLVAACVGDAGHFTYKQSRRGNAEIDRAVAHVLQHAGQPHKIVEFSPYGYDERQYCSPGFNLAVGSLSRTPHGTFPEYHTSDDNLDFVHTDCLAESLQHYLQVIGILERNRTYRNCNPFCEPQLGKRGLYSALGGHKDTKAREMAMLWVLNFADGDHSLLDIAERSDLPFDTVADVADALIAAELLEEVK